jgi:hypothetical protein
LVVNMVADGKRDEKRDPGRIGTGERGKGQERVRDLRG